MATQLISMTTTPGVTSMFIVMTAHYYVTCRESDAVYTPPKGNAVHIGFPLPEALWRTNHGYDPVIRQHYQWSEAPSSWSNQRYIFIHNTIKDYQDTGVSELLLCYHHTH